MVECVKCGQENSEKELACVNCSWPFHIRGWKSTKYIVRRVTIDTCCINANRRNDDLNILESWSNKGLIVLQRSDALIEELIGERRILKAKLIDKHPPVWKFPTSLEVDSNLGGPDLTEKIRNILFPSTSILLKDQERDIEHLKLHVITGGDVFVTINLKDFIGRDKHKPANYKQIELSRLGIWVFMPNSLVSFLHELYNWER